MASSPSPPPSPSWFHHAWPDATAYVITQYKDVQRLPYGPNRFQPGRILLICFLAFLVTLLSLALYYSTSASLCTSQLEYKQWGEDPSCTTIYDDAFAGDSWQRRGQLLNDYSMLPIAHPEIVAFTTNPSSQFTPKTCLSGYDLDGPDLFKQFPGLEANVTWVYDPRFNTTSIRIRAEVAWDLPFTILISGVYRPVKHLPYIAQGPPFEVFRIRILDNPRRWNESELQWERIPSDLTDAVVLPVMYNFVYQSLLYFQIGVLVSSACEEFVRGQHLQQCNRCEGLGWGVALPLFASNAVTAAQVFFAISVVWVRCAFPPSEAAEEEKGKCGREEKRRSSEEELEIGKFEGKGRGEARRGWCEVYREVLLAPPSDSGGECGLMQQQQQHCQQWTRM